MRYLIVSDIHANLAAFDAVLADAGSFDKIWHLGDLVGYGPDANEVIDRLKPLPHFSLAGNHDWAALGKLDLRYFNSDARESALWTQKNLSQENRAYLEALMPIAVENGYTLAHGSPNQPIEEYILDPLTAELNFSAFTTPVCLVGHTHWPTSYFMGKDTDRLCVQRSPQWNKSVELNDGRWIINPGSVGQPRDGNPAASYGILDLDTEKWEHRRAQYPVDVTQNKMRELKFPNRLIERLAHGH